MLPCCRGKKDILYQKGREKIDEEMNVIYILNSLQKIKATMAIMVKDMAENREILGLDHDLIEKSKKLYI